MLTRGTDSDNAGSLQTTRCLGKGGEAGSSQRRCRRPQVSQPALAGSKFHTRGAEAPAGMLEVAGHRLVPGHRAPLFPGGRARELLAVC